MNLYQKGFLLAYLAPSLPEQPGTYRSLELHIATLLCSKTVVPQTGKAVEGVCPEVVQGWAQTAEANNRRKMTKMKFALIIFSDWQSLLTRKNIVSLQREETILYEYDFFKFRQLAASESQPAHSFKELIMKIRLLRAQSLFK